MNVKTVLDSIERVLCQETEGDDLFIPEHISEKVGEVLVNCRELLQRFESVEVFLAEFPHLENVIIDFDLFIKSKKLHLNYHDENATVINFKSHNINYGHVQIESQNKISKQFISFAPDAITDENICGALNRLAQHYLIAAMIISANETDEVAIKHLLEKANEKPNQ